MNNHVMTSETMISSCLGTTVEKSLATVQEQNLTALDNQKKLRYAQYLIKTCERKLGIGREQLQELVRSWNAEDAVLLFEERLVKSLSGEVRLRCLAPLVLLVPAVGALTSLILLASLPGILFGGAITMYLGFVLGGYLEALSPSFSPLCLADHIHTETTEARSLKNSLQFLALRRYLQKRYGPNYFPYQEFIAELERETK